MQKIMRSICFSVMAFALVFTGCGIAMSEKDFIKSDLHGKIEKLKDGQHDVFDITVKQHHPDTTLNFLLFIGRFIKENDIRVNDSIYKSANSHSIFFYKKRAGIYQKPVELYYH